MNTEIKKRIELNAELCLYTYAEIKSYVESAKTIYGIIKYELINTYKNIGFRYEIEKDRLIFMDIDKMAKMAYYTICKN